jgi:hypothetical protein
MAAISLMGAKQSFFLSNNPGLFTIPATQPNINAGKALAHEAVENYCKWATMRPML